MIYLKSFNTYFLKEEVMINELTKSQILEKYKEELTVAEKEIKELNRLFIDFENTAKRSHDYFDDTLDKVESLMLKNKYSQDLIDFIEEEVNSRVFNIHSINDIVNFIYDLQETIKIEYVFSGITFYLELAKKYFKK